MFSSRADLQRATDARERLCADPVERDLNRAFMLRSASAAYKAS